MKSWAMIYITEGEELKIHLSHCLAWFTLGMQSPRNVDDILAEQRIQFHWAHITREGRQMNEISEKNSPEFNFNTCGEEKSTVRSSDAKVAT